MIGSDIEFPGNRILEILKMPGNIHNVMNPANTKEILRYRIFGTKSERALVFARHAVERFVVPHWGKIAKHLLTHRNLKRRQVINDRKRILPLHMQRCALEGMGRTRCAPAIDRVKTN